MDLSPFFKSIIDQDDAPVVICDLANIIIYMNPSAIEEYSDETGEGLVGRPIFDCHPPHAIRMIDSVVRWFSESKENNRVHTFYNEAKNKDVYMVALRDEAGELIGYYEKHESRTKDPVPFYQSMRRI